MSRKTRQRLVKSLARLTEKFDLKRDKLMDSIREAFKEGNANCGELEIILRQKNKDSAMFLFSEKGDPIMQFSISTSDLKISRRDRSLRFWRFK